MKFDSIWEAAKHVQDGSRVTVRYESKRSDKVLEKEGEVMRVVAPTTRDKEEMDLDYNVYVAFKRDDGQTMYAYDTKGLHTSSSQYPYVGSIVSVEVENAVDDPVELPESDAYNAALNDAENFKRKNFNMADYHALRCGLDSLEERGITPKEDWDSAKTTAWLDEFQERMEALETECPVCSGAGYKWRHGRKRECGLCEGTGVYDDSDEEEKEPDGGMLLGKQDVPV